MFGTKKTVNPPFNNMNNIKKGNGTKILTIAVVLIVLAILVSESYYSIK